MAVRQVCTVLVEALSPLSVLFISVEDENRLPLEKAYKITKNISNLRNKCNGYVTFYKK